ADLLLLEVLRRAAGLELVDAQIQLEGALVADRRGADGPSVRDGAADLLLELGRTLALRVARSRREREGRDAREDGRKCSSGSQVTGLTPVPRAPLLFS